MRERRREKKRSLVKKAEREEAIGREARLVSLDGLSEQPCGLTSAQRGGEYLLMAWEGERRIDREWERDYVVQKKRAQQEEQACRC